MPEREPAPGDVLGDRYEVQAELGRGGMSTVYRGRDRRLDRRVAIKVFRGAFAESVDPQRRTQEMQLLATVNHPSIVDVLDASNGDGVFGPYLVMELVTGDDLGALLHRARGPLNADFARRIVADVASALAALHARGVVHRDVKPANILVPASALSPTAAVAAKLTDFGIAQLVDGAAATGGDVVLGTAAYLSPEQVRGAPPRGASDVYSLGLVLLEALTGRRAFPGPAAEAAMARLHRRPQLPPDASPPLADLLSRMTALEPAQRPGAAAVATALREQLAGRVTAPEAAHTTPTPIAGLPTVPRAADATAPHETLLTPGRGMPLPAAAAARDQGGRRRRFPAVLAVAASALAAGVAGVAISAGAGTTPSGGPASGPVGVPPAAAAPRTSAATESAPVAVAPRQSRSPRASAPPSASRTRPSTSPSASPSAAPSASEAPGGESPSAAPPSASAAPSVPAFTPSAPPSAAPDPSAPPSSTAPQAEPSVAAAAQVPPADPPAASTQ